MKASDLGLQTRIFQVGERPLKDRPLYQRAMEGAYQLSPISHSPAFTGGALGEVMLGNYVTASVLASVATFFTLAGIVEDKMKRDGLFLTDTTITEKLKEYRASKSIRSLGENESAVKPTVKTAHL